MKKLWSKITRSNNAENPLFNDILADGEAGCDTSLWMIGTYYLDGSGVRQDEAKAVTYFKRSADAGNSLAMCSLADCYQAGRGVAKDDEKAFKWLTQAYEEDQVGTAVRLGKAYEEGRGCVKDLAAALACFQKVPLDNELYGPDARAGEQRVRALLPPE